MNRKLKIALTAGKVGFYLAGAVALSHAIVTGTKILGASINQVIDEAKATVQEKFATEKIVVVSPEQIDTEKLIESISAEFGINPIVTKAMAIQESGEWTKTDRVRFEPGLHGKFKTPSGLNEIERQFYASSFGILQVIWGWHGVDPCGLSSYSQLLEPATNIRCGLTVLTKNLKGTKGTPGQRLKVALRKYNGSGQDAIDYSNKVMARITELSLGQVFQIESVK